MTRKGFRPALVLFFLALAIGELLSGSSPPLEFFNPIVLVIQAALYGSGAIVARELTVRWGKTWPTLHALGAAHDILEVGLAVKSFFHPHWVNLGILGTYGRWAGVNWVWSLELTIYQAVFSITIPVALTTLILTPGWPKGGSHSATIPSTWPPSRSGTSARGSTTYDLVRQLMENTCSGYTEGGNCIRRRITFEGGSLGAGWYCQAAGDQLLHALGSLRLQDSCRRRRVAPAGLGG